MNDEKSVHIHINGPVSGSAITVGNANRVQQTIQHSFNTPASPDLAPLLAELTQAVEAMLSHLPPEDAEEVHDDMERLQEELQKPKPRRKWYSVSIEGLQQAAQNLGEIGKPVLELAGRILTVLHAAGL